MTDKNSNHKGLQADKFQYSELPAYEIHRHVLLQENANQISGYQQAKSNIADKVSQVCEDFSIVNTIKQTIPVIEWLPKYQFKKNIMGDITSGMTVAVMHIPQGMAYGILAGCSPSVGLYTAIFESFMYFIFGTSRHISIGTFAVVSLMVSKIVGQYATDSPLLAMNSTSLDSISAAIEYTPIQVVTAVTKVVGFVHMLMFVLRLGILATLLSEPLVNGFTTAAAVHVFVSQTKDLFGIQIPKYKSYFKVVYTIRDIAQNIQNFNPVTLQVSVVVVIFMIAMNEFLKPWMEKKCRFPLPSELIAVVGGTTVSYIFSFGPSYAVRLVGTIPAGLPAPELPPVDLFGKVLFDAVVIAIVTYSIVMSMGLIFAKKQSYEVRANQELFALSICNIVGSMFSCLPTSCSLSRSLIQEQTGGKTQVASVVSSAILLVVLLHIGPFFEHLPRCVLAGVIIVALKGMFMQAKQLKVFYQQGKMEALIWCITFFGVILIDIDVGLLLGVLISLVSLYLKSCKSHSCLLGQIDDSGIYVDLKHHKNAAEVPTIKIFRFVGSINFASRGNFKKSLYKKINLTVQTIRRASVMNGNGHSESKKLHGIQTVIVDLSSIMCMDSAGCKTLSEIQKEMQLLGILFLIAAPLDLVYEALLHSQALGDGPYNIFPSIHDAVLFSQGKLLDV